MEALMKEGGGGDHLSVAMKRPGGFGPKPISKKYLFAKLPGMYMISIGIPLIFIRLSTTSG
jgi:hypothetical protein